MIKHYTLTLRAAPGCDGVRNLRALLKIAWRHFGLRAVDIRETTNTPQPWRSAAGCKLSSARKVTKMDMSEYAGSRFLKVQDVKGGAIRARIIKVDVGKYEKPNIHFDDATILSGNATNVRTLCRAYGNDSDGWLDKEIELTLGTIEYQGEDQEAIVVNPISPPEPKTTAKATTKAKAKSSDMDSEVSF